MRSLTKDKPTELVAQSVTDPDLFRPLLVGPTASQKVQERAAQRISAWLASPASEQAPEQTE